MTLEASFWLQMAEKLLDQVSHQQNEEKLCIMTYFGHWWW
jgi:hypothetical protein